MVELEIVQSFGEGLKKNLQCPICLSLLKNPTSGECLHKFCRSCIDKQIAIRKRPKCPICNKPISRRGLRETGELKSVLRGVESILTSLNDEGSSEQHNDDPIIPFSQFDLSTCDSPEKIPDTTLKKALTTPNTTTTVIPQPSVDPLKTPALKTPALKTPALKTPALKTPALKTPALKTPALKTPALKTPALKTKSKMIAKTPARKWTVKDCESYSRKRRKTDECQPPKAPVEPNQLLLDTIEKGNLGDKKKKPCKRMQEVANQARTEKAAVSQENEKENEKENKKPEKTKKLSVETTPNQVLFLDMNSAAAAKSRALERLKKNALWAEASGKVSNLSLNSTTYQSPKPTTSVSKKVSPFVLKPLNRGSISSPEVTIIEKPVTTGKPNVSVESDDNDSLDYIGTKNKNGERKEIKILSSEDESPPPKSAAGSTNSSKRRSLKRKSVKPSIIEEDDEEEVPIVQVPLTDEFEPNTVEVLEMSFGLKGPSAVFGNSISIKNTATKSKPSEVVIRIGKTAEEKVAESKQQNPDMDTEHIMIESSGKSVEIVEKIHNSSMEEDLPSCGMDSELTENSTGEIVLREKEQDSKPLPKPDLPDVFKFKKASSIPTKPSLSRLKPVSSRVLETPKLDHLPHSNQAPITPLLADVIKSTNTVLETPMASKSEQVQTHDTPVSRNIGNDQDELPSEKRKRRSIEFEDDDEEECQTSQEKRARRSDSEREEPDVLVTEQDNSVQPLTTQNEVKNTKSYPNGNMKEFLNKFMESDKSKRALNSTTIATPVARKNAVVEKVYNVPGEKKTSPKLTIDKNGNKINYTIEKDSPAAKLTIIQEGQMISPKLMKHIYEDVLHSDPDSCAILLNSLTADNENSLRNKNNHKEQSQDAKSMQNQNSEQSDSCKVDHTALIFGQESAPEQSEAEVVGTSREVPPANGPDSLEGYTYHCNTHFNEAEFKKTFGIVNDSCVVENDKVNSIEPDTNVCDEVKLSQLSQQRRLVKDSQPNTEQPPPPDESQPENNLNMARVFDTVPEKTVTTAAESGGECETPTKFKQPLSSSTQRSKATSSPTTPNLTLVSSNGHVYTTQEIALIEQQLKENELALLRLHEIEQAGIVVADTLQPDTCPKPENSGDVQINETVIEQDSFTQGELFDDVGSGSNDVTICEPDNAIEEDPAVEKTMVPGSRTKKSESDNESIQECQTESKEEKVRCTGEETREEIVTEVSKGAEECNTAELIALNDAAIYCTTVVSKANKIRTSRARDKNITVVKPEETTTKHTAPPESNSLSLSDINNEINCKITDQISTVDPNDFMDTSQNTLKGRKVTSQDPPSKGKENEVVMDSLPKPDISADGSVSSDISPPQVETSEQSPVIVCRRPSIHKTPTIKTVNVLLSGMVGRSGSKEAFRLRKLIRESCQVQFRVLTQYTDAVTHLVFPHNDTMTCGRTTKYLRGLAGGKWIVSNEWLKQSYKSKELVNEAPYEMQGDLNNGRTGAPRSARLAKALNQPPLFANVSVYFIGEIRILKQAEFSLLLEAVGVNIVPRPSAGTSQMTYKTQSKVSPLIDSDVMDINKVRRDIGECPLTAEWVIECISNYRIIPPEEISQ